MCIKEQLSNNNTTLDKVQTEETERKLNMNTQYNTLSWYWIFIVLKFSVVQCLIEKYEQIFNSIYSKLCLFFEKKIFKKIWNVVWTKILLRNTRTYMNIIDKKNSKDYLANQLSVSVVI